MMNGQTGKLCGKLPIDFKRLAVLFGIVSGSIILLSMLTLLGGVFDDKSAEFSLFFFFFSL